MKLSFWKIKDKAESDALVEAALIIEKLANFLLQNGKDQDNSTSSTLRNEAYNWII
jgi:hypothetical protein